MYADPVSTPADLHLLPWAKTARDNPLGWHPLLYHMLDVAAVAGALWNRSLSPWSRCFAATQLGVSEDEASRLLAFWSGIHDLGKACPDFQYRYEPGKVRLQNVGFSGQLPSRRAPHGVVTAATLPEILTDVYGASWESAARIGAIIGGHHGQLPSASTMKVLPSDAVGAGWWNAMRRALVQQLAVYTGVQDTSHVSVLTPAASLWLAGFVSIADWIGSNTDFFPPACRGDETLNDRQTPEYFAEAGRIATRALTTLGWMARPQPSFSPSFESLFEFQPNAMQQAVIQIGDQLTGPTIAIIEAPTGDGKSEAGFWLADRLSIVTGQVGAYVALPTQATSNQMFERARQFLQRRYPDDDIALQLLHGHAALSAEFQLLLEQGGRLFQPRGVGEPGDWTAGVAAAEWFTYRKRGLLAPFGVGTIDQSLLAVLQSRHLFVRLFGLAGKTIIFDEVHAYDMYMSSILEQLLAWLAALGSSVILLSATLPRGRRDRLLAAYAGPAAGASLPIADSPYPRVAWWSPGSSASAPVQASPAAHKTIQLQWLPNDAADALGKQLHDLLRHGGTAAVICNTVRRAQETYQALKPFFPGTSNDGLPTLDLLHARFTFASREERERRVLLRFGKSDRDKESETQRSQIVHRPDRAVLVATQVIEQSLDLDFDVMVTDLAPVDLLLQRAGRLQRHSPNRPAPFKNRACLLIRGSDVDSDGAPTFDRGTLAVYDDHALLRTWLALQERTEIRVPEDVSALIEAVYDLRRCPNTLSPAVRDLWIRTLEKHDEDTKREAGLAAERIIKSPWYVGEVSDLAREQLEEDAPDLHSAFQAVTRLGDSIPVILLSPDMAASANADKPTVLLRHALSLSDCRLYHQLRDQAPPTEWQRSPLLRHHRRVLLDADGRGAIGDIPVRPDGELGFMITDKEER